MLNKVAIKKKKKIIQTFGFAVIFSSLHISPMPMKKLLFALFSILFLKCLNKLHKKKNYIQKYPPKTISTNKLQISASQLDIPYTQACIKSKSRHTTEKKYTTSIWAPSLTQLNMIPKKLILHIFDHIFHGKLN